MDKKFMDKKKSYRDAFLSLLNKIEYLTSEEHKNEVEKENKYPYAYIVGEIIASAKWEQFEVTHDMNILDFMK